MIIFDNDTQDKLYTSEQFEKLEGYIPEDVAKATLGQFLYNNLGLTSELLLGIRLFPFQEMILRGWFEHNFNMFVASRGGSKSYLSAIFCCLYPVFYPGTRIVLTANAFRSTRRTIQQVEKFLNGKKADLIRQCFLAKTGHLEFQRRSDEHMMEINEGSIIALPLNEKLRGTRGDILFCDEFLMLSEELYRNVLLPFLTAKSNIQEVMERQDEIDKYGEISTEERELLEANKKVIALTSASYDFEFAHRVYQNWVKKIEDKGPTSRKYFVARMSYESLPEELIEKEIVEEAKMGGAESASFQREFMAIFASTSDGYFNIKKLHDNTVEAGDLPCVQLKGNKDSKYIIAVDPSTSGSKAGDFFAMGVYLINTDDRSLTLVHSFGRAGEDLKNIIKYLYYLIVSFNVVFIIADLGGANFNFFETCNESAFFLERGMRLGYVDGNMDSPDYLEQIRLAKNSYNLSNHKIAYRQIFTAEWLRKSNEYLQAQIDRNKVKFASPLAGHELMLTKALKDNYPILFENAGDQEKQILDMVALQDDFIEETKKQLALIECKVTPLGTMQFDLPQHMRRSRNPNRARRDNYTCYLMATWGAKVYWDIMFTEAKKVTEIMEPKLI